MLRGAGVGENLFIFFEKEKFNSKMYEENRGKDRRNEMTEIMFYYYSFETLFYKSDLRLYFRFWPYLEPLSSGNIRGLCRN